MKEPSREPEPTVEEYEDFLGSLTVEDEALEAAQGPPSCDTCNNDLSFESSYDAYWCGICKEFRAI